MTTVTPTITELPSAGVGSAYTVTWKNMANGQTGIPFVLHGYHDRSLQVEGTIGAAGSVQFEGSNDGTNFEILNDPSSTALVFTALAKVKGVLEATSQVRPNVTAGDGTTSITVTLYCRRTSSS